MIYRICSFICDKFQRLFRRSLNKCTPKRTPKCSPKVSPSQKRKEEFVHLSRKKEAGIGIRLSKKTLSAEKAKAPSLLQVPIVQTQTQNFSQVEVVQAQGPFRVPAAQTQTQELVSSKVPVAQASISYQVPVAQASVPSKVPVVNSQTQRSSQVRVSHGLSQVPVSQSSAQKSSRVQTEHVPSQISVEKENLKRKSDDISEPIESVPKKNRLIERPKFGKEVSFEHVLKKHNPTIENIGYLTNETKCAMAIAYARVIGDQKCTLSDIDMKDEQNAVISIHNNLTGSTQSFNFKNEYIAGGSYGTVSKTTIGNYPSFATKSCSGTEGLREDRKNRNITETNEDMSNIISSIQNLPSVSIRDPKNHVIQSGFALPLANCDLSKARFDPNYPDKCIRMIKDIVKGVSQLHKVHVLHGDIKPANMLDVSDQTSGTSNYLLGDIGYAQAIPGGNHFFTSKLESVACTLWYRPSEANKKSKLDDSDDEDEDEDEDDEDEDDNDTDYYNSKRVPHYGLPVDIYATGMSFLEIMTNKWFKNFIKKYDTHLSIRQIKRDDSDKFFFSSIMVEEKRIWREKLLDVSYLQSIGIGESKHCDLIRILHDMIEPVPENRPTALEVKDRLDLLFP
jgi:hypothetical protein